MLADGTCHDFIVSRSASTKMERDIRFTSNKGASSVVT
jgi:hypothetical protein